MRHTRVVGALTLGFWFLINSAFAAEATTAGAAPPRGKIITLFDGKTLDGWIMEPAGRPTNISGDSIADLAGLVKKIAGKADPLSQFLFEELDDAGKMAITSFEESNAASAKAVRSAIAKSMNKAINDPSSLYEQKRFEGVKLRVETVVLVNKDPQGKELARVNRMLLEDAYPNELTPSAASPWVVKDGAMSSTGAGRGTIYTKDDYNKYRLMFSMRQVKGNHQPCVLIFCTRPTQGVKPLDALGGIQFQVPNGGHWDYRPGQNKAGVGFLNPTKPKFDNKQWSRVEILVDATKGTARMAVANPANAKAIEVLDYNVPEAGKTGPIAWQMHNGGIFDEYKDVTIEINPEVDDLITIK